MHMVYFCTACIIMAMSMVVRSNMPVRTTVVVLVRSSVIRNLRWLRMTTATYVIMIHVESTVVIHYSCRSVVRNLRWRMSWCVMLLMVVVMMVVLTFT